MNLGYHHSDEYCQCGEHMGHWVPGTFYCSAECEAYFEGKPDPARDTIACVLATEIAEEEARG